MCDQIATIMDSSEGLSRASDDDDNNFVPLPESACKESTGIEDEVIAETDAASPIGVASGIVSAKERERSRLLLIKKNRQNRLLRKLIKSVDEFATEVGQQAIVLVATPGKLNTYKVFEAQSLDDVIKNLRSLIMKELKHVLAHQATSVIEDSTLFKLPPLIIDGKPTPLEYMTIGQLRTFIPFMLKYSTGHHKPGWGIESKRPPWWPKDLPWTNVKTDPRTEDEKKKISWTLVLKQIVINCYKYHNRGDLLGGFTAKNEKPNSGVTTDAHVGSSVGFLKMHLSSKVPFDKIKTEHTPTVLHPITNSDGTTAHVQEQIHSTQDKGGTQVHSITEDGIQSKVLI